MALALGAWVLGACAQDGPTPTPGPFPVAGRLVAASGRSVPERGQIYLVWEVTVGDDYLYIHGHGTSTGARYTLTLDGGPPEDALNAGLGVAFLLLVPEGHGVPEGRMLEDDFEGLAATALGASGRRAVIYRDPGWTESEQLQWAAAFPEGLACGLGVPAELGFDTFDTFDPLECDRVDLQVDDLENIEFTNWT